MPESAGICHADQNGGTNPIAYRPSARPLTDRQLAAARLIVRGYGSVEIAAHLGVNRHTVACWKRHPAFAIELQRLRAYLTAAAVATLAPRAGAGSVATQPPRRDAPARMTRAQVAQEDAECEAMIAGMLRSGQQRRGG
ncbi:MAG: hypothetical protein M3478_05610 [Planctomycetota bacterium]|nr:hypothetical protein [Planctomycetota bacterium]